MIDHSQLAKQIDELLDKAMAWDALMSDDELVHQLFDAAAMGAGADTGPHPLHLRAGMQAIISRGVQTFEQAWSLGDTLSRGTIDDVAEDLRARGHSSMVMLPEGFETGHWRLVRDDSASARVHEAQHDLTAARERAKDELQDIATAPTQLVLTVDEIAEMLASWGGLPESEEEARDAVVSYVEHMRAGEFDVGREI